MFDGQKYLAANPADVPDANGTGTNPDGHKIKYSTTENTLRIYFDTLDPTAGNQIFAANGKIRLSGNFDATETASAAYLNGKNLLFLAFNIVCLLILPMVTFK